MTSPLLDPGRKILIANVHLLPLPGESGYEGGGMRPIIERAVTEARIAHDAGFDAVLLQDLGDRRHPRDGGVETAACMAVAAAEILARVGCRLGVNYLPVGARTALSVAKAVGADFVRIKVFVGAVVGADGVIDGGYEEALGHRAAIDADDIPIVADVFDRTTRPVGDWTIAEAARMAVDRGRAAGLIVTGRSIDESIARLDEVRAEGPRVPIWCGGGSTPANVRGLLERYDGAIVGMGIKPGGDIHAAFDPALAHAYVAAARSGR